ncbi:hypothetical protein DFA_06341 [Cavenderia fasciculata]|uniref:Uncharacterized protein n=1 Tax=Cavenderia fasciculata TaxID=261658 RepID=F4PKS0_CACFS|nr:uncharacterized protein DFA_06341 [Cavenderia fasciculata]EGG24194.1 hypothetical protein DFA_06341 [Cavenderia fasciculata]|eukprot:XP_004362045.1 hypothetical protein DFA_06341 [Cavenderia fasciculata]
MVEEGGSNELLILTTDSFTSTTSTRTQNETYDDDEDEDYDDDDDNDSFSLEKEKKKKLANEEEEEEDGKSKRYTENELKKTQNKRLEFKLKMVDNNPLYDYNKGVLEYSLPWPIIGRILDLVWTATSICTCYYHSQFVQKMKDGMTLNHFRYHDCGASQRDISMWEVYKESRMQCPMHSYHFWLEMNPPPPPPPPIKPVKLLDKADNFKVKEKDEEEEEEEEEEDYDSDENYDNSENDMDNADYETKMDHIFSTSTDIALVTMRDKNRWRYQLLGLSKRVFQFLSSKHCTSLRFKYRPATSWPHVTSQYFPIKTPKVVTLLQTIHALPTDTPVFSMIEKLKLDIFYLKPPHNKALPIIFKNIKSLTAFCNSSTTRGGDKLPFLKLYTPQFILCFKNLTALNLEQYEDRFDLIVFLDAGKDN